MAKPKYDYKSREFLDEIEKLAKKGLTDKEIAISIGLAPQTFSEKKGKVTELGEVLSRARTTLNAAIRAKFLALAMGGVKVRTVTSSSIKDEMGGLTDNKLIETVEAELPPNLNAISTWLFHHDEEWRERTVAKVDLTTNGKDIAPQKVNVEIVYNKSEDVELQDKKAALESGKEN